MFAKYETDKKDRTILLLNTQQKLYQQQISRQHILAILIVSVALFGVFIGLVLWNRRGIKQKLKELEMRNQLSSDLHDDIGSSLSSILLLSTMAAQKQDDPVIHNKLLEKINNNAKEVIDRMSDIVWTMNPKFDEGDSLHEKLENYITRLKEITPINITGNIDDKIDRIQFTMELRKNIFLIIKEAMNNALKHAGATLLQLDLNIKEKHFEVVITDNGIGFEKAETQGGNGFETMINRAKASNGDCSITSFLGRGTVVKAVIPIPHIR
jgi:signal transduction histidine kinase